MGLYDPREEGIGIILPLIGSTIALIVGAIIYSVKKHSKPHHVDSTYLQTMDISKDSLFSIFQSSLVPMEEVRKRGYSSALSIVQQMIGVQPTCDSVLEIWPPCFECYNVIVPNFLNFPQMLFGAPGSVDVNLISLVMYASSRANECAYCTAHCCTFAVRRGVDPAILRNLLLELNHGDSTASSSSVSRKESLAIELGYGLGTVPCSLTKETVEQIKKEFSSSQIEWLVAATAMFGEFNKLMDGLNIPLEPDTYQETVDLMDTNYKIGSASAMLDDINKKRRKPPPPKDNWTNYLAILYHGLCPGGALDVDAKLLKDIPTDKIECLKYLNNKLGGCDAFQSVMRPLQHVRFIRAITAVVVRNFCSDDGSGALLLPLKLTVGKQYCDILENQVLAKELDTILQSIKPDHLEVDDDEFHKLVMKVGMTLSYAPSRMTPYLVSQIRNLDEFTPAKVVELVSFLASCQMLHRIICFDVVDKSND